MTRLQNSAAMFAFIACFAAAGRANAQTPKLDVKLDVDQAEAVLWLVERRPAAGAPDWQRLFESEGYRRLKVREGGVRRPFTDSSFRAFVLDTALARRAPALRRTLDAWKRVRLDSAAARAFAYLPAAARIRATIYPSIKPRSNTFVFEPRTNPAIFFYLDPAMSAAQFDNTIAHELHHLGVASVCNNDSAPLAVQWMSGFAEGRAVLAAAGNPEAHPHVNSPPDERAVWDRDFAKVPADMERLEEFFTALMDGALNEQQQNERGFQFVSTDSVPQGAFYTVGYQMARAVEQALGRERLVASTCDPRAFLSDYNQVAKQRNLPLWSSKFMTRLSSQPATRNQ
jgi:hypothetical protein